MSNEPQSLDDVFTDTEETVEEVVEEPVVEESEEPAEPEVTAEPEPEAPAASENIEDESWTKAAVLDERRKRQALEAEIAQLRQTEPAAKAPDVFDDQDKYTEYLTSEVRQEVSKARVEISQEMMRMQDPEYDTKEAEFVEMAKDNQQLAQQLMQHAMPAKFVVDTVNKARELKKLDNIDEYKSQLRAEMEAQVREELKAEMEQKQKETDKVSSIKPSLATARASKDQGEAVDQSLGDLFGR